MAIFPHFRFLRTGFHVNQPALELYVIGDDLELLTELLLSSGYCRCDSLCLFLLYISLCLFVFKTGSHCEALA